MTTENMPENIPDDFPPGEWVFHACVICGSSIYFEPEHRVTCARCRPLTYMPPMGWLEIGVS